MQWVKIMLAEELLDLFYINIGNNTINWLLFVLCPSRCDEGSEVAFKKIP